MNQVDSLISTNTKNLLDAIPAFVFAVDEDVRIIAYNSAAEALLDSNHIASINVRAGEALHCIHSFEVPQGCGCAPVCKDCVIRNAVTSAYGGDKVSRKRAKIELSIAGQTAEIFAVITASPFVFDGKKRVLLLIEDISELIAIQDIVPICMKCKKVQSVDEFWTALESYFKKNWGIDFSHGYCPECGEEVRKEFRSYIEKKEMR